MSITVYGASDDLIEVEGDVREEFYYRDDEENLLAFSTGVVLRITYSTSGIWRITPVHGMAAITQVSEEDPDSYTDQAVIEGAKRVVHGSGISS